MTDLCNGCGVCCDPVVLPYTQDEIRMLLPYQLAQIGVDKRERDWMLTVLRPIPRREGLARVASYITAGGKTAGSADPRSAPVIAHSWFYECGWYDPETRRCTHYEERPRTCADYPWYGEGPDRQKALPLECGYRAEIGQPVHIRTEVGR